VSYIRLSDLPERLESVFVSRVPGIMPYAERPSTLLFPEDMETIKRIGRDTAKRTGARWVNFPGGVFYSAAGDWVGIV
jgi:hypothetical protein